jgi:polyisoprenoid-binding protein YceI
MNKTFLLLATCLATAVTLTAQNRYFTKTGQISFYSHTAIEDIKANNDQVTSFLDISTGEIVFSVLIRSFQFPKPLMQEHFNENYMESEKFPKASFDGKITNLSSVDFNNPAKYPVKVSGKLTIHGVTKELETTGELSVDKDKLAAVSVFSISPEEYNIKIPAVVRQNIAESLKVTVQMNYQLYVPKK